MYLIRHWRGDLSLPVSYWINGWLLTALFGALLGVAGPAMDFTSAPRAYASGMIGIWVALCLGTVWQFAGIWRSATKHVGRGGRRIWADAAKVMVVIGTLATIATLANQGVPQVREYARIAAGDRGADGYQVRVLRNATDLELSGYLGFGVTDDIQRALDAHPAIRTIHLNSEGGRVGEARRLRDLIEQRRLRTYTATHCASACVIAFAAGAERLISRHAVLGFHRYAFPGAKDTDFEPAYRKEREYFLARGVTQQFVNQIFSTPHTTLWKPSHEELFQSGFVSAYADTSDVALSGVRPTGLGDMERDLLHVPLYAALKEFEPDAYQRLKQNLRDALQQGKTETEMRAQTLPTLAAIYTKRLPYASTTALLDAVSLIVDQGRTIERKSSHACLAYLGLAPGANAGAATLDPSAVFSREMHEREFRVMAEVIRSAHVAPTQPPGREAVVGHLERLFWGLRKRFGDDVALLEQPATTAESVARKCDVALSFYEDILQLPQAESVPILRVIFSAS